MENLLLLLIILGGIYLLFRSFKKRPLSELSKEQQKFVKIGENVVDTFQTGYSKVKKNAEKKFLQHIWLATIGIYKPMKTMI